MRAPANRSAVVPPLYGARPQAGRTADAAPRHRRVRAQAGRAMPSHSIAGWKHPLPHRLLQRDAAIRFEAIPVDGWQRAACEIFLFRRSAALAWMHAHVEVVEAAEHDL